MWRPVAIEWQQDERRARLTADGELHMGRIKVPGRPASFEPMIRTMQAVSVEVRQADAGLSGVVRAGADAPDGVLRQVGARPGGEVASFSGDLEGRTRGRVTVTTPDGRRREIALEVQDDGDRIIARAVPVFGESRERAGDVTLVRSER